MVSRVILSRHGESPFSQGHADATETLSECSLEELGEISAWTTDWTEALINATTERQRILFGLDLPEALVEYQRGCLAAVKDHFESLAENNC